MKTLTFEQIPVSRGIEVQWTQVAWEEPIDRVHYVDDRSILNVAVTPRPQNARGRYEGGVGSRQFEPIGRIMFMPHGVPMHGLGECGALTMLRLVFEASVLGAEHGWTRRQLQGGLDLSQDRIRSNCLRVLSEMLEPGFASRAAIEASCQLLAIDLARNFDTIGDAGDERHRGGLGPAQLRKVGERLALPGPPPTVTELAVLCGMTRRHLHRCFTQEFGVAPAEYIAAWRADRACRMLMEGGKIKQIAFALGFSDAAAFTVAFRKAMGVTPAVFRQRALM